MRKWTKTFLKTFGRANTKTHWQISGNQDTLGQKLRDDCVCYCCGRGERGEEQSSRRLFAGPKLIIQHQSNNWSNNQSNHDKSDIPRYHDPETSWDISFISQALGYLIFGNCCPTTWGGVIQVENFIPGCCENFKVSRDVSTLNHVQILKEYSIPILSQHCWSTNVEG